jgi:RNA polymerase sigma-70 factor (ECF subfamily)
MEIQDNALIFSTIADGNHDAFNALFTLYYPKIKFYLTRFLKDNDEASDMAQDIFYKIWDNRETCSHINNYNAFLYSMARNALYNYFEHNQIKENYASKNHEPADYSDLLEGELYAKELGLLIEIAIEQMPEQRQRIFKMSRKKGFTNDEISIQLNISKRTVENQLSLALIDLRKIIA